MIYVIIFKVSVMYRIKHTLKLLVYVQLYCSVKLWLAIIFFYILHYKLGKKYSIMIFTLNC